MAISPEAWDHLINRLEGVGFTREQIAGLTLGSERLARKMAEGAKLTRSDRREAATAAARLEALAAGRERSTRREEDKGWTAGRGRWVKVEIAPGQFVSRWVRFPYDGTVRDFVEEYADELADIIDDETDRYGTDAGGIQGVTLMPGSPAIGTRVIPL